MSPREHPPAQDRSRPLRALALGALIALAVLHGTPVARAAGRVRGYPIVLDAASNGGVYYGGALEPVGWGGNTSGGSTPLDQLGYITPAGGFIDYPFPTELATHWAQYLAAGAHGVEWFLAEAEEDESPLIGEVSALGAAGVVRLHVRHRSLIRGLARGADGDLWTTETRTRGHRFAGAILRITPAGRVTRFTRGLERNAAPANIVAGPDHDLWFTDSSGRIGRIAGDGAIHEFPIGRPISSGDRSFEPARPIVAGRDGHIWFIADGATIGRLSTSGHVQFFTPRSSYRGVEAWGQESELVGLAAAPDGEIWFTREAGEVARIDTAGRAATITNRLDNAFGIAFSAGGVAWIGEGGRYRVQPSEFGRPEEAVPARVASIRPSGSVRQYPPGTACHVPWMLGNGRPELELSMQPERPFYGELLEAYVERECERRIRLGHVTIRGGSHKGELVVVSQTPKPGTRVAGYARVNVTLGLAPPLPKSCRSPALYTLLAHTPDLIMWTVPGGDYERRPAPLLYLELESTITYYACTPPDGRKRRLFEEEDSAGGASTLEAIKSAGHYVALISSSGGEIGSDNSLRVVDVKSGSVFHVALSEYVGYPGDSSSADPDLEAIGGVIGHGARTFALDAAGDVAWLGEAVETPGQPLQLVLYLHDHSGTHEVAVGAAISRVAFAGGELTWKSAGVTRSAPA